MESRKSAAQFQSSCYKTNKNAQSLLRRSRPIVLVMALSLFILCMTMLKPARAAGYSPTWENDSIPGGITAPSIIPVPQQYVLLPGLNNAEDFFELNSGTPIILEGGTRFLIDSKLRQQWQAYLQASMLHFSGRQIDFSFKEQRHTQDLQASQGEEKAILLRLVTDKNNKSYPINKADEHKGPASPAVAQSSNRTQLKGAYSLHIAPDKVVITAGEPEGFFYGLISLLQLGIHQANAAGPSAKIAIPAWQINDQPEYDWRGVMLDESRHFFGKAHVKKLLDWMAYYKLNHFHWHLTDEPGWRLEIKAFPKLTTVGGIGNKTDSAAPATYYTQSDIAEVVRYAKARNITVIPEIDMPGHATAANRAYPANSGGGQGKYANFTFNPGRDSTYRFLTEILRETKEVFGVDLVHLGGDEVSFGSGGWGELPAVKTLMARENLQNNKAVEAYFLRRMADSALQFNKKIMTWDEGVDAGLDPASTIIFWWRHDKVPAFAKAMKEGYDIVLCPRVPLYFDFVQDSTHKVGRKWKGDYASLKQVFDFYPPAYTRHMEKNGRVLGMQANLWTETVQTDKRLDYMLFPRMAALASAAWSKASVRQYEHFMETLKKELDLYKKDGIYYYNPFDPALTPEAKE